MKDGGAMMAVVALMLLGGMVGYFIGADSTRGPIDELTLATPDDVLATASSFEAGLLVPTDKFGTTSIWYATNAIVMGPPSSSSAGDLDAEVTMVDGTTTRHDICEVDAGWLRCERPRAYYTRHATARIAIVAREGGDR